jgi:hypothetical protein
MVELGVLSLNFYSRDSVHYIFIIIYWYNIRNYNFSLNIQQLAWYNFIRVMLYHTNINNEKVMNGDNEIGGNFKHFFCLLSIVSTHYFLVNYLFISYTNHFPLYIHNFWLISLCLLVMLGIMWLFTFLIYSPYKIF